ncbi:hypothetical protein [Luteimonas lutimaris]|uniref:Uncharacterized protein n=1 Tax=Luteimonas lutimaris TaxID=698645 RepID=A0ABP7M6G4_9GAMM
MPIRLSIAMLLGALALAAVASGCRQSREAFADSALAPAAMGLPAHEAQATAARRVAGIGAARGEALPLPADFPDDVYLPPGYRIDSLMDRGNLRVVSLRAPGRVSSLFEAARSSMDERGWKQALAMREGGDSAMLSYEKADRTTVLSFSDAGDDRGAVAVSVQLRSGAL